VRERIAELGRYIVSNLILGLIVVVPIVATVWVVLTLFNVMDNLLFNLLPTALRPQTWLGVRVPGLGILLTFSLVFVAGVLARNYLGKQALDYSDRMLRRVPLLRSVYFASRQFLEHLFVDRAQAFRRVVAIEYPRKGLYTLAFVTGETRGLISRGVPDETLLSVFVPTTPNPTSGYLLLVPESQALPVVISGGVLAAERQGDLLERLGVRRQPGVTVGNDKDPAYEKEDVGA